MVALSGVMAKIGTLEPEEVVFDLAIMIYDATIWLSGTFRTFPARMRDTVELECYKKRP